MTGFICGPRTYPESQQHDDIIGDGMGDPVTLRYPGGPDSSMVEHLVPFQKGLGSSPSLVTFHAAIIGPIKLGVVQDFSYMCNSRIIIDNTEDPMLSTT